LLQMFVFLFRYVIFWAIHYYPSPKKDLWSFTISTRLHVLKKQKVIKYRSVVDLLFIYFETLLGLSLKSEPARYFGIILYN